jgi:hypothetical protein
MTSNNHEGPVANQILFIELRILDEPLLLNIYPSPRHFLTQQTLKRDDPYHRSYTACKLSYLELRII